MASVLMQSARFSSARRCSVRAQATAKPTKPHTNEKQNAVQSQVRAWRRDTIATCLENRPPLAAGRVVFELGTRSREYGWVRSRIRSFLDS